MKKVTTTLAVLLVALSLFAQSPSFLQYQAIVRNSSGLVIQNQAVSFRFSLMQGTPGGTSVYQETHNPLTNDFGLVNLLIGDGTPSLGNFQTVNWGNGPYFLKVETDPAGGTAWTDMGTTQMVSVPVILSGDAATNVFGSHLQVNQTSGEVHMLPVYSDVVGATYRDLFIDDTGKLGYVSSSKRYKTEIETMDSVPWLFELRPVTYILKSDKSRKMEYGLIAEEVMDINPGVVSLDAENLPETVNYTKLIAPILRAVQLQQAEIQQLKTDQEELLKKMEELEVENNELKSLIEQKGN
jgi:hypothetical protein